jgi:hypothetical protein
MDTTYPPRLGDRGKGKQMTSTQTTVNASIARELAADLGVSVDIDTAGESIVLTFRPDYTIECATLEEACAEIREYAKS